MRIAAVLIFMSLISPGAAFAQEAKTITLRVMTYNIHSCKGRDRKIRPDRIADVIGRHRPDIVALQEVRVGRVDPETVDRPKRSRDEGIVEPPVGEPPLPPPSVISPRKPADTAAAAIPFTDQPGAIADALGMYHVFYPLVRVRPEDYGIAILSRYPLTIIRASNLPTLERRKALERRGAIWVEADVNGTPVQILGTHLGLNSGERADQIKFLLGPDWMAHPKFKEPYAVCGDLNARPSQFPYKQLARIAVDAVASALGSKAPATWPSRFPAFRIDHIFVPKSAHVISAEVPEDELTVMSSDHLPVVVEVAFDFPRGKKASTGP